MKKWSLIIASIFCIVLTPFSVLGKESKKVVLVLGSGGSKGLAHVGVIEELEHLGIIPDLIVGCSSGAIVGALYAQHQDISKVKEVLIDMKYDDLVDLTFFQKCALSSRDKLENFLKSHLTVTDFSCMKTRFVAVATDLDKGEPVYFNKGELHAAVLASSALPVLFPPYKIGDKLYVDGGVTDPLPVRFKHDLKDAIVIASDISASLDGFDADSLVNVLRKSFEVMYQRLAYFARSEVDILLEMNFMNVDSPIADDANHEVYQKGKEVVQNNSQEIREKVLKKKGCAEKVLKSF